jgi:transcriptional regulator with PAS, ATPase and Fis domain
LDVIRLHVSPLRDRASDVILLSEYFISELSPLPKKLTKKAIQKLFSYHWPGNVRELKNVIARSLACSKTEVIDAQDLHIYSLT